MMKIAEGIEIHKKNPSFYTRLIDFIHLSYFIHAHSSKKIIEFIRIRGPSTRFPIRLFVKLNDSTNRQRQAESFNLQNEAQISTNNLLVFFKLRIFKQIRINDRQVTARLYK